MRRSYVAAAAALVIVLIIIGSIYLAAPLLLHSSQTTATTSSSSTGPIASSSQSASSQSASSTSSSVNAEGWTTYHADNARTGYLPASNFTSVTDGWTSPTLDGAIYAEPLVFRGEVLVATENNSVYALNAQNGSVLWHRNLGMPVASDQLQCGDINPSGITGTP